MELTHRDSIENKDRITRSSGVKKLYTAKHYIGYCDDLSAAIYLRSSLEK